MFKGLVVRLAFVASLLIAACIGTAFYKATQRIPDRASELRAGMTIEEVEAIMGCPGDVGPIRSSHIPITWNAYGFEVEVFFSRFRPEATSAYLSWVSWSGEAQHKWLFTSAPGVLGKRPKRFSCNQLAARIPSLEISNRCQRS